MGEIIKAVLIGLVQGITEWLPVSSTGHMIILDEFVRLDVSPAFWELFLVVIQLASVLAVPALYFDRLNPLDRRKTDIERRGTLSLWKNIALAVLPSGIIGLLLDDWLDAHIYNSTTVIAALAFYGILFIVCDRRKDRIGLHKTKIFAKDALGLGTFQTLALIPGTSRSGSTLLGGLVLGLDRAETAEFSFFMALPTMLGASGLKLVKFIQSGAVISGQERRILLWGSVTAFLVSMAAMRYLVGYVRSHGLRAFGIYRLILAALAALVLRR